MRAVLVNPGLVNLIVGLLVLLQGQTPVQRLALTEELRIGSADGPDALSEIHRLLTDRELKTLFVMQAAAREIKIIDARTGRLLRTFGRRGPGPAEFMTMGPMQWKQDTLLVIERPPARVLMFSARGDFLRGARQPLVAVTGRKYSAAAAAIAPDGALWAESRGSSGSTQPDAAERPTAVVLAGPDGRMLGYVGQYANPRLTEMAAVGGSRLIYDVPLGRRSYSAYAPDASSVLIVDAPENSDRFTIMRVLSSGDTVYRRAFRYAPHSVPAVVRDSIYARFARVMEKRTGRSAALAAARSLIKIPELQPPVSSVLLDWDGRAWLRMEDRGTSTVTWLLHAPDGRLQAIIDAPTDLKVLAARGNTVWGATKGEFDIPQVVRYRLSANAARER